MEKLARNNSHADSRQDPPADDVEQPDESPGGAADETGVNSGTESTSSSADEDVTILAWEPNDPGNPYNFSKRRKMYIQLVSTLTILNATLGSSLPSNIVPKLAAEWHVTSTYQKILPISVYIMGYVTGPIFFAPASEQFGRRLITIVPFFFFVIFTMACGLAPNFPAFLIFRLFSGISASAPMTIAAGTFADIFGDPRSRGRAMAFFMVATVFGPLIAPIISGFCAETLGWKWTFWIATIYAGFTLILLLPLPETYGPILLQRRARSIRKADPKSRVYAPHEIDRPDLKKLATVVLTRPIRMMMSELIVSLSSAYLSLVYGVFYMSFSAYPIIFQGVYHMSPGVCGLTYLVIGAGAFLSLPPFYWYDGYLYRKQQAGARWAHQEEYRRLPLACLGGPLYAVSLFWLGWSARPDVHWAAPMMAGLFFGMGWMLIFIALLNYLTDAYEIFAASANAAAAVARSIVAVVLPLATTPMFNRLGIAKACTLLGAIALLFSCVPFLFIWQGVKIRANSKFCIYLKQRKEDMAREAEEKQRGSGPEKGVLGAQNEDETPGDVV